MLNYIIKKITQVDRRDLEDFYKRHGFQKKGKRYFEDGIPHISMIKKSSNG